MCLAIFADKSGAVDGDDHLLLLESGIVQKLIKAALEEGGIDCKNRDKSALCKTERERHGVLLGNADIKKSVFMFARKSVESSADGHRGGYGAHAVIAGREATHDIAEFARKARTGRERLAGIYIKLRDSVELLGRTLGKIITLALESIDMEKYGFVILLCHLKRFAELLDIVPVNRTDIVKSEILEPRIGIDNALQCALYIKRGIRKLISDDRDMFQELFGVRFHAVIFRLCSDDGKITRHRADIFGDRHLVIIEHDYEPVVRSAGVV